MAAFSDMAAAETRAVSQVEAGTWLVAHACRTEDGTIACRVIRPASPTNRGYGGWTFITDDATD